ncbi:MAG: ABC transporter ATP-binding protein [Clostridium sp.]|uniref:ABC transporter ATP-binding protein n=1 Tax=Clostridium culturomicium TaxID=1499683 RepID=UPI00058BB2CA|nr:ABC transporter ATP-binding protein [Clostridium culturomicium]MDU4889459.1 ABC transporter ATP-binding protein [Clostridium sp.]MDU7082897.1 ABC transporter ATP-binding protein [Clostridium sp.]
MIKFENITKKFKDTSVIKNLSFEIEEGKLVAFIGASGCGKTTTLKMINRLIKPTTGHIYIDGEDIATKDVIELRRNMGYVIQQTGLFPHMTIKENIELIPKVQKQDSEKIKARTLELMDMVGLNPEDYLDRYPTELSGGQQQRVGVARAFATDPKIILMDEPFSALDPITRTGLQDELLNLQSKLKKTIVFVTHDMSEAIKIADMICIMDGGNIVQYDTPENILKYPINSFVAEFVGKNRIWTSPEFIKSEDIMIENPVTCHRNMELFKCIETMRHSKVDSLMVIDTKTRFLEGIITAKEIQGVADKSKPVNTVMRTRFPSVSNDDNIIQVLKTVDSHNVSDIPVLNNKGILLGLITKSSLITTLSQQYLESEVS